ncbi:MAG: hypothetical protein WCG80_12905 [Spirochaetales bacterium]
MKVVFALFTLFATLLAAPLSAQEAVAASDVPAPTNLLADAAEFVKSTHLHQIAGGTTILLAGATGVAGVASALDWDVPGGWVTHKALAGGTILAGAGTLALGLTAYSDRLDEVWPHAALMGLAELGWIVSASLADTEAGPNPQGVLVHRVAEGVSTASLIAGLAAMILINLQ